MTPTSEPGLRELLQTKSVVVCMGPGGVGKTTTAAALAIAGASIGLRVAVLTVDPARRLAEAMGLGIADEAISATTSLGTSGGLDNDPRRIPGPWSGELWGVMLDPQATFDALISEHSTGDKQRDAILNNKLYRNLTTTLTGTNEYMAAERLRSLHLDSRFDLVVLDTPPAHHAIDLLDSPGRLSRFVDHRVYRTLLAPRRPGVFKALTSAANVVVRALGQVVGNTLLADAIEFFNEFQGMDQGFRDRAATIDGVLASEDTAYVLVSSPRHDPLDALRWIQGQLAQRSRPVGALVINRMTPNFWPADDTDYWLDKAKSDDPLVANLVEMIKLRSTEVELVDAARADFGNPKQILIDEQSKPIADLDALSKVAKKLL